MFSPISASENIKEEFIGYISTLFHISDKEYAAQFAAALREEGAVTKGPYLDVSDSYKTGKSQKEKHLLCSRLWRVTFLMGTRNCR